jgi:exopolysaccharide production protein ExoQ
MTTLDSRGFRLGFATFVLFTGVAGDFWRNLTTWYGYGAIVLAITIVSGILLARNRARFRIQNLPYPLLAFIALSFLSIAWSFYPGFTALGAVVILVESAAAVSLAITLSWDELLTALGRVFRLILGLSFVFEFIVSVFIRHPIYPVWVVPDDPKHPAALLYWSRDLLFHTGKIQGILGNSSLLAMAALLGLIVFGIQLATKSVRRGTGWLWVAVALIAIAITQSATIFVGLAVVVLVTAASSLVRRAPSPSSRSAAYGVIGLFIAAAIVIGAAFHTLLFRVLNTISTGRLDIWHDVIGLAQQRPAFGWGWLGYWIVWIKPFKGLITKGGVQVPHAHDAWLDVWLQLGILGVIVFAALVVATLARSWLMSVDRVVTAPNTVGAYSYLSMLPLLMLTAQLVQSLAESRILLEGGWILLVVWAVKTKLTPIGLEPGSPPLMPAARMTS